MTAEVADFSGYATKNGLLCADGLTINHGAFKDQDRTRVPLVWQHQHGEVDQVLGHGILENRPDGTYVYGFFNDSPSGRVAKELVVHGDVNALSIFANKLRKAGKNVVHGVIREVSLVLAGANPGARIDTVNLAHGEDGTEMLEAEITTGDSFDLVFGEKYELVHGDAEVDKDDEVTDPKAEAEVEVDSTSDDNTNTDEVIVDPAGTPSTEVPGPTVTDPNPNPDAPQNDPIPGEDPNDNIQHANTEGAVMAEKTIKDVYDAFTEEQKNVVHFMIGEALDEADGDDDNLAQSAVDIYKEGFDMGRNVFQDNATTGGSNTTDTLMHDAFSGDNLVNIISEAKKLGSFRDAFLAHAESTDYGIENIDILFPDARLVNQSPDIIGRRTEWVANVLASTKHSPFSRIKSTAADITADEARAKGYVKGTRKKDEVIKLLKRVTTPGTIYKKQKLDRDDIVDITDLDVVAFLKAEMRLMLDEELARAILIGDGRESDDEDKIDEDHIRPIATDDDMYAHQLTIASNLDAKGVIESIIRARKYYKGTGTPTLYTTDDVLTDLILLEDKVGRPLYATEAELAAKLRVAKIVTVEVMDSAPEIIGILVNLADYTIGADQGGNVSMFDDFDIDFNQYKYLIETRVSGALTKPKSAVVVKRVLGTVVTPNQPSYNSATHVLTIPNIEGVQYSVEGVNVNAGNRTLTESETVEASPKTGYSFPANTITNWDYTFTA